MNEFEPAFLSEKTEQWRFAKNGVWCCALLFDRDCHNTNPVISCTYCY